MGDTLNNGEYARSLSDNDSELDKKKRKNRRRRGRQPRFRPYPTLSPDEDVDTVEAVADRSDRRRSDRHANGKPMAPFNTTQFLLEDLAARTEEGAQDDLNKLPNRQRSISVGNEQISVHSYSDQGSSSGESDTDKGLDQDFETEYLSVKRERMDNMTKSELQEELLERDRDTETLHDECEKMHSENRHLKELLAANGIAYEEAQLSPAAQNVAAV
ncbi:unnamed protein product [Caenorhabditis auriculariae]|uniref:Uncharacterized protein n=1 Tax=Caenorhabditis auriculariae TaxID=2777116 RepID=A0A8S1HF11_9PELO|nr:unnamed protein product [Caenorhabditis auriculariae]